MRIQFATTLDHIDWLPTFTSFESTFINELQELKREICSLMYGNDIFDHDKNWPCYVCYQVFKAPKKHGNKLVLLFVCQSMKYVTMCSFWFNL